MSQTKAQLIDNLVQALNFTGTASAPANGLFLSATNTLQLSTASTPRLTINSDGHVDVVGNLDVGAGIDVAGASTLDGGNVTNSLQIDGTGGHELYSYHDSGGVGWATGAGGTYGELLYLDESGSTVRLYSGGTERFRVSGSEIVINETGENTDFRVEGDTNINLLFCDAGNDRVGIGINNPATALSVGGVIKSNVNANDGTSTAIRTENSGTGTTVASYGFASGNSQKASIRAHVLGNGAMMFHNNDDTEKMRIDASGKVGIGTTPSTNLHVKNGSGDCLVKVESESGYDARLQLDTSNGGGAAAHLDFQMDGTTKGGIEYINNASSALVNCMIFRTTDLSERVRIDADGNVTAAHSIVSANLPGRNLLINGAMQVNQRVGSPNLGYFNPVTAAVYTLDRWKVVIGSGFDTDSAHITKSSTSPAGFGASMRWEIGNTETPSANQNCGIEQKIEAQNLQGLAYGTSSAKTMTLSFHVYSNKTGTYCVQIMQEDGTKYQMHEYTISSSNTWEKKTITIVGNTSNAINNDTGVGLRIIWMLTVGSGDHVAASSTWVSGGDLAATSNQVNLWDNGDNNWYLTGCQLEVGTIATEFEHIDFGNELRSCQRYFFNVKGDNNHRTGIPGYANSTSSLRAMVNFPTAMRGTPSFNGSATAMVFDAADDSASFNCNTLSSAGSLTNTDPHMMMIETSTSGMTSGEAGTLEFRAANGFLEFSSEL